MTFDYPETKTLRVKLDQFDKGLDKRRDESLMPERPFDSYNFCLSGGSLVDGMGIKYYSVNVEGVETVPILKDERIKNVYFYKRFDVEENSYDNRLIVYCKSGKLYELPLSGGEFTLLDKTFSVAPKAVNYTLNGEDVIIFSSETGISVYDGETFSDYSAPQITSMCVHAERLFVTTGGESTTLWFSENFDPTNWYVSLDEAGFIDFCDGLGKVNRVIEFEGNVFIFRDTGITKLSGYFDQSEFFATNVSVSKDVIYPGTIADCGKYVMYLTSDGFYSFNGSYSIRVMKGLTPALVGADNSIAGAAYFNGKYYCMLNVKIGDNIERRMVVYDLTDGSYYLTNGIDVRDILPVYEDVNKLLFVVGENQTLGELDKKCMLFGKALRKLWVSNRSSFGVDKIKTLAKINICSEVDSIVRIRSDFGERAVFVSAAKSVKSIPVGLKGKYFTICVESDYPAANVNSVSVQLRY